MTQALAVEVEMLAEALHEALGEEHLERAWPDCETLADATFAILRSRTDNPEETE
jgi:hypothetical protein